MTFACLITFWSSVFESGFLSRFAEHLKLQMKWIEPVRYSLPLEMTLRVSQHE